MKLLNGWIKIRIPSSTLVEVIVALTIIMINFSILAMLISNINASLNVFNKFKAFARSEMIINQTNANEEYINEDFEYKAFTVKRRIKDYNEISTLKQIEIVAIDKKGKAIITRKYLKPVDEEQKTK